MRLFVTGGTGYLGRVVIRHAARLGWVVVAPGSAELDVRDEPAVAAALAAARPDAVVHTAYRLDGPDAWSTNVDGTRSVAAAATGCRARLVHISTDVVFHGRRDGAYRETDGVAPVHEYGRSKVEAERLVASLAPTATIVRTSLIYGGVDPSEHERAALEARHPFFTNEIRSPIQVDDLAAALLELCKRDISGPLHVSGADDVSRFEFAELVVRRHAGDPARLRRALSTGEGRPLNCALDSTAARGLLRTRLRGAREVLAGG